MIIAPPTRLESVLHHPAVAADCVEKLALYSWLIGNWQTEVVTHDMDGNSHPGKGEIRAGWILEGRAIQDVWTYGTDSGRALLYPGSFLLGNFGACYECGHDHSTDPSMTAAIATPSCRSSNRRSCGPAWHTNSLNVQSLSPATNRPAGRLIALAVPLMAGGPFRCMFLSAVRLRPMDGALPLDTK
jgi:hypothetical protein